MQKIEIIVQKSKEKKLRKKIRKQRQKDWTINQQIGYAQFLKKHINLMKTFQSRKKHKVFKQMSQLIKTRTPNQLKSHHYKLMEKHSIISKIILFIECSVRRRLIHQQTINKTNLENLKIEEANPQAQQFQPKIEQSDRQVEPILHKKQEYSENYNYFMISKDIKAQPQA